MAGTRRDTPDDSGNPEDDGGPGSGTGDNGNGGGGNAGPGPGNGSGGGPCGGGFAANVELTIPLATLLGIAERAGEADWLGAIDPDLARSLAARAAASPRSTFQIVVTDQNGYATGFGIARRRPGTGSQRRPGRDTPPPAGHHEPASPRDSPPTAEFTPPSSPQPPIPGLDGTRPGGTGPGGPGLGGAGLGGSGAGGYGSWRLRIGDLELIADLYRIPRDGCGAPASRRPHTKPGALLRSPGPDPGRILLTAHLRPPPPEL